MEYPIKMYKFLGLNMKPGRKYTQPIKESFIISNIAIGEGESAELYVTHKKKTFLAAKVSKVIPQVRLQLYFHRDDKIVFQIKGDAMVSLVGYWYNMDSDMAGAQAEDDEEDDEDDDDDDDGEEEEQDDDGSRLIEYESFQENGEEVDDEDESAEEEDSDSEDEEEVAQPKAKIAKLSPKIIVKKGAK